jgi:hypothetical protein
MEKKQNQQKPRLPPRWIRGSSKPIEICHHQDQGREHAVDKLENPTSLSIARAIFSTVCENQKQHNHPADREQVGCNR